MSDKPKSTGKILLKALFLASPAIVFSFCELTMAELYREPFFSSGMWRLVMIPLLTIIPILVLYIIKEKRRKISFDLSFLIINSLFCLTGIVFLFIYLGLGIAFGMKLSRAIYIPFAFLLFIAITIFFTIESIKQIKNFKKRGIF